MILCNKNYKSITYLNSDLNYFRKYYFVSEGEEIPKRIAFFFFAQSKQDRAFTIKFVDLVYVQFLNNGCKNKNKNHKSHTMNYQKSIILWDKKYTNT